MREFFGFNEMSQDDFRALQLKVLDNLLYFDEFCKQHKLRYYLAGGTLIGAIRHKGYIPWDEDIDVHMPRVDYDKLPHLWSQYADTEHYTLCRTTKDKNFHHHAMSIVDNYTTYIEEHNKNEDIPQGIPMDILPFDGCPKGWIKTNIQLFWAFIFAVYNVQRLPENQGGGMLKLLTKMALAFVPKTETRYAIWNYAEKKMTRYNFETSPYVKELVAPIHSMFIKYPREHFTHAEYLSFEGHPFPAQHYYKDYLDQVYGNYMELPPKEKQKPKSVVSYINLECSYKNYKGVHYCVKPSGEGNRR